MEPAAPSPAVVIDCHRTRYHVVRAAARQVGWTVDDSNTEERIPDTFHGVQLRAGEGPHGEASAAVPHAAEVMWVDKSVVSTAVAKLPCYARLNHFAGMNVVARKALLFRRLMQLARLHAGERFPAQDGHRDSAASSSVTANTALHRFFALAVPPSFSSLTDLGRLAAYRRELADRPVGAEAAAPVFFIIKPNTGCEGRGIRLSVSPEDDLSEEERTSKQRECIVQLYIDRPLLLGGRKFDLRLYVLLLTTVPPRPSTRKSSRPGASQPSAEVANADTRLPSHVPSGVQGVELYVHREGLVRICAEPYAVPTLENCGDAWRHLTNYAVNKRSALYVPHAEAEPVERASSQAVPAGRGGGGGEAESNKQSLEAFAAHIESLGTSGGWPLVRRRIDECVALTVLSGVEVLRREFVGAGGTRGSRADGRSCFELLGFDVLLRERDLQPVLMEVNHSPSLFCDTAFDFAVKSAVLRDTFRLLQSHMPLWTRHEGVPQRYEACMQGDAMDEAAEGLLRGGDGAAPCGFRRVLPRYGTGDEVTTEGDEALWDWTPEDRAAQQRIVELSKRLP